MEESRYGLLDGAPNETDLVGFDYSDDGQPGLNTRKPP
jgi:hypothetical protein